MKSTKKNSKTVKPAKKVAPKKGVAKKAVAKVPAKKAAPKKKAAVKPAPVKKAVSSLKKPAAKVAKLLFKKPAAAPVKQKATTKKVVPPLKKEVVKKVVPAAKIKETPVKLAVPKPPAPKKAVAAKPVKPEIKQKTVEVPLPPEPKRTSKHIKFEVEYTVHASSRLLYECFSTPSGLSEWFADDVNYRDDIYTFYWDKAEQKARLIFTRENKATRFQWLEEPKDTYFEFRIEIDELTNDVALIITDFAEDKDSKEASKLLWDSQIEHLLKAIGSY